ncbi:MAG: hypothetical protein ACTHWH_06240 [Marinobacter sp.]
MFTFKSWNWKHILVPTALLMVLQLAAVGSAEAVPAYARQTGMNCNSCHIGTYSVPNFTRTGRLFAMHGYTKPYMRERLRSDGDTANDNENDQYGGDYLALNWTDYFSARFISNFASGGDDSTGKSRDVKGNPLDRLALFYTGAITDWLGVWVEIGYLGNNSLRSVNADGDREPTGLNYFAYDEYRVAATWDFGENSFYGFSVGNEHPNSIGQWNYPLILPDLWYNGQGGVGRSRNIENLSAQMFYNDRWWLQLSAVTGGDNTNWSDGTNIYANISRNFIRTQKNDVWLTVEYYGGNDFPSLMSPKKTSFLCPDGCPDGVVDTNLSITNIPGFTSESIAGAPIREVDDFDSYKVTVQHAVADWGHHSWFAGAGLTGMVQHLDDRLGGGKIERTLWGLSLRYFYDRTYGFEIYYRDDINYDYTTQTGEKRGTFSKADYGLTALWYPAMNVDFYLRWVPRDDNTVFEDEREKYTDKASSYILGMEYNF